MSLTRNSTLDDPQRIIADLRHQLTLRTAERDDAQRQLKERTAERDEALEEQTATAEVLQVINSSPGDLAPVFDAMLERAMQLCEAQLGLLLHHEGGCFRLASSYGASPEFVEFLSRQPIQPGPHTGLAQLTRQKQFVHIDDLAAGVAYQQRDPLRVASVDLAGMRTFLAIPLVKEGDLIGAFVIYRQEVRPFSSKQIALLQNFAAQAVIGMENARLLSELRQRTDQVAELNRGLEARVAEQVEELNSSNPTVSPMLRNIVNSHAGHPSHTLSRGADEG